MTQEDLARALLRAESIAATLRRSQTRLHGMFPLTGQVLVARDEADREALDAFLKRFENLVNHVQDQLFRLVVDIARDGDVAGMSRRDVLDYLEKIGALDSADGFLDATRVRNRLAHVYPDDPEREAGQLNRAFAASDSALAAVRSVAEWARARGMLAPP